MSKLKSKMLRLARIEDVLLFLTLLFLPTQLGKHFWPKFSYIYSLKIDYLSPTLYFWDILVAGLLVVWILGKPKINKTALNLFLFFLFAQTLSLLGAFNIGSGLVRLEQYILAGLFGVYLASNKGKAIRGKIFLPLSIAVLGESVIAILQFVKGGTLGLWILGERTFSMSTPAIAKFDFYGREFLRPYATSPHPNVLAGFMLITIVILIRQLAEKDFYDKRRSGMAIQKMVVVLGGLTVFLTMSRTAILAGFVTLIILLRRKWLKVITVIMIILSPILFTRFSAVFNFDNLTLLRREELSVSAWKMFLEFPIFGVGLNNFIPAVAGNLITGPSRFLQPVHNICLLVLAETGIIGLVGFVLLVGYPIKIIVNRLWFIGKKQSTMTIYDIRYTIFPWFLILFLGMFDHYFLTLPQGYRLLFLVWGLSFAVLE